MLKGIITTFAVIAVLYTYGACKYAYTEAHGGNHNSARHQQAPITIESEKCQRAENVEVSLYASAAKVDE